MEETVAETLRQECARLEVRFDGEFAGLFWFADSKEGEVSYGAGFAIKANVAAPKRALGEKLYELRRRFRPEYR